MAEENATVPTKKTRRKSDGKRGFTFVYLKEDGTLACGVHRTKAFSRDEAWKEFSEKQNIVSKTWIGLVGQVEEMPKKIRKPTTAELMKLAGLED